MNANNCVGFVSGVSIQQYVKDLLNQYESHYKHLPLLRLKR